MSIATTAAITMFQADELSVAMSIFSPICTVRTVSSFVTSNGHKYLFQVVKNPYMAKALNDDLDKGKANLR